MGHYQAGFAHCLTELSKWTYMPLNSCLCFQMTFFTLSFTLLTYMILDLSKYVQTLLLLKADIVVMLV